jgi:hypothetical protein
LARALYKTRGATPRWDPTHGGWAREEATLKFRWFTALTNGTLGHVMRWKEGQREREKYDRRGNYDVKEQEK